METKCCAMRSLEVGGQSAGMPLLALYYENILNCIYEEVSLKEIDKDLRCGP